MSSSLLGPLTSGGTAAFITAASALSIFRSYKKKDGGNVQRRLLQSGLVEADV